MEALIKALCPADPNRAATYFRAGSKALPGKACDHAGGSVEMPMKALARQNRADYHVTESRPVLSEKKKSKL